MKDQSTVITTGIILGFIIGFIIGAYLYNIFGWKPSDPTPTDESFITISMGACGFVGSIFGVFIALGILVYIF